MIASMQRLERVARIQLERLYEGTRRVGPSTHDALDRRAVERVHELMALTRRRERGSGRQPPR